MRAMCFLLGLNDIDFHQYLQKYSSLSIRMVFFSHNNCLLSKNVICIEILACKWANNYFGFKNTWQSIYGNIVCVGCLMKLPQWTSTIPSWIWTTWEPAFRSMQSKWNAMTQENWFLHSGNTLIYFVEVLYFSWCLNGLFVMHIKLRCKFGFEFLCLWCLLWPQIRPKTIIF